MSVECEIYDHSLCNSPRIIYKNNNMLIVIIPYTEALLILNLEICKESMFKGI